MPPLRQAIVILGHSNAGKSPVGILIEDTLSTLQQRFLHLDFGEHLRAICSGQSNPGLAPNQIATVRSVMNGTLLDDSDFPIACAIVDNFWSVNRMVPGSDYLILNGLPRHQGQAHGLSGMGVSVEMIIVLECPAHIAWERKNLADQGKGFEDRSQRDDGAYEIFARKIKSFEDDTLPLVAWYKERNVPLLNVPIKVNTTPYDAFSAVNKELRELTAQ